MLFCAYIVLKSEPVGFSDRLDCIKFCHFGVVVWLVFHYFYTLLSSFLCCFRCTSVVLIFGFICSFCSHFEVFVLIDRLFYITFRFLRLLDSLCVSRFVAFSVLCLSVLFFFFVPNLAENLKCYSA